MGRERERTQGRIAMLRCKAPRDRRPLQGTASLLTRVAIEQAVPCIATYVGHWHYTTTVLGAGRQAEREGRGADRTG
jgi:hypothetical protein